MPMRTKLEQKEYGDPAHGTTTKYRYGCRCDDCKRASANARWELRHIPTWLQE